MLKGLKVLSLACKCPFCRSEHNTKRDPMKVLNCKNEKDRVQREYEKNWGDLSGYHAYFQSYRH